MKQYLNLFSYFQIFVIDIFICINQLLVDSQIFEHHSLASTTMDRPSCYCVGRRW